MKRLIPFFLLLILLAGGAYVALNKPTPAVEIGATAIPQAVPEMPTPTNTAIPTPYTPAPDEPDTYYWLLLGGDYRDHRVGTKYGNKTDVILLVATHMTDPVQITVFQFPRNLYMPIENMDDQWLFGVYGREGFEGLHYYFQEAFGVAIQGIFYVHMDSFVELVERAAPNGIPIRTSHSTIKDMDGDEILEYLRDNENMWGCGADLMDCENRQFNVLRSLAVYFQKYIVESPAIAATTILDSFGDLFESDISEIGQYVQLANIGWLIKGGYEQIGIFKLSNSPYVMYGDTPLEVRGYIPQEGYNLHDWIPSILR